MRFLFLPLLSHSGEMLALSFFLGLTFLLVTTSAEAKAKRLASSLSTSLPQPTGNTSQLLPCSALAVVSIKEDPMHL